MDRIVGFIKYKESDYPFEFNDQKFELNIYPPTKEVWKKNNDIVDIFNSINSFFNKEHKWIQSTDLSGVTSDLKNICFNVKENEGNYQGFVSFEVNYALIYDQDISLSQVNGFILTGFDIDLFYSPMKVLEQNYEYDPITHKPCNANVNAKDEIIESCGKYVADNNLEVIIEAKSYAVMHFKNCNNPISSQSEIITTYYSIKGFLWYISYRSNISINDISLFYFDDNQKKNYCGTIMLPRNINKEKHEDVKKRIIPFEVLKECSADIVKLINERKIGFKHICKSISDTTHYSSSRTILIFAEFEKEFRMIYGTNVGRSDKFISVLNDIIKILKDKVEEETGERKRYYKSICRFVSKYDLGFGENLKYALNDCKSILEYTIKKNYKGKFNEVINDLCMRMGNYRNDIAHCKLEFNLEAINIIDIETVEKLLYAMRLKQLEISVDNSIIAIKKLFGDDI